MNILYIGRFELPDKEATANRVIANAKALRALGHDVVLAGWTDDLPAKSNWRESYFYGFRSYEKHKAKSSKEKADMFFNATPELFLLKKEKFDLIIAYDFPAVALRKIIKYCKQNSILCVGDVSEWYTNSNKNPLFRIVRAYDSFLRMRILHKRMDGLIVISRYLQNYYRKQKTVLVPPLIDLTDEKWAPIPKNNDGFVHFIYAGWPSKIKERLDLIVSSVEALSEKYSVKLDIYGITADKYAQIYNTAVQFEECVTFHGRVPHTEAVNALKAADVSLIIRDSSRKNNAGFPSKFVESIGCGTPVLVTDISNVRDYLGENKNGMIVSADTLTIDMEDAISKTNVIRVEKDTFDYRKHIKSIDDFIHCVCKG